MKNSNKNNFKKNNAKRVTREELEFLEIMAASKPSVEETPIGVPLTLKCLDKNSEMPLMVDEAKYCRKYKVDPGKIYTLRLGIHSQPNGAGSIPLDSVGVLTLPTIADTELQITALFSFADIAPAAFWDTIILCSDEEIKVEYIVGSMKLEPNNGLGGLTLSNPHIQMEDDLMFLSYSELGDELPAHTYFAYDYITVQVMIKPLE